MGHISQKLSKWYGCTPFIIRHGLCKKNFCLNDIITCTRKMLKHEVRTTRPVLKSGVLPHMRGYTYPTPLFMPVGYNYHEIHHALIQMVQNEVLHALCWKIVKFHQNGFFALHGGTPPPPLRPPPPPPPPPPSPPPKKNSSRGTITVKLIMHWSNAWKWGTTRPVIQNWLNFTENGVLPHPIFTLWLWG